MASEAVTDTEASALTGLEDMDVDNPNTLQYGAKGESNAKRERAEDGEENGAVSKEQKVEKFVEEDRLAKLESEEREGKSSVVDLGPKRFGSSVEMFDYFYKILHFWPPHLNLNQYEYMVLLDLIKKGQPEPDKKIGEGVRAFQVQYHPTWKSRCFFLLRADDSVDDFSFRKCVDHILPLPDNMKVQPEVDKALGGGGSGRHGGGQGRGKSGR